MQSSIRLGAALIALVLVLVACAGPAASPTRSEAPPTNTVTQSPTQPAESPAESPSESPAESPSESPAESPSESPAESPAESPSPSPSPSPPPAAAEGTLTIWADEQRAPVFEQIGEAFTTETGVEVVVHQLGFGDIRDYMTNRAPVGEGPDIAIGAHDWLGQLVSAGVVEPLDLSGVAEQIDPVALQAFTYDGEVYGLPYATEAIALYYNADLVPEPPATWDELKTMAADLQADAESGVTQGYCMQQGDPYHTYPLLTGFGGYIFGYDEAAGAYDPQDVGLDSPGGVAYAQELDQLVKDGLLLANVDYGACLNQMTSGQSAFWITGPWALADFNNSGINFGVAPIPEMENTPRPFVGVQGMMVSAFAPNKLQAETFLTEFMATDEAMQSIFDQDPRPPAWTAVAERVTDENVLAFIESGANGNPMPAIPEMASVWESWTQAINLIFTQEEDPETAITDAAETIREQIPDPE
jgi:arabinogalactan oligomer / maltooligosaccharide transport system substrate-binding protein